MNKHTKGPWLYLRRHEIMEGGKPNPLFDVDTGDELPPITSIQNQEGGCVVSCHDLSTIKEGDARLIAEAPTMLELCEQSLAVLNAKEIDAIQALALVERLKGVIQKVRGE